MVDVGLHMHPALDRHLGRVGAVVGGQVIGAKRLEVRVVQPRIAEPVEIPMVDVRVDHGELTGSS
jgi:hypothetical protein